MSVLDRLDDLKDREGEEAPGEQRTDDAPPSQLLEPHRQIHGALPDKPIEAGRTRRPKSPAVNQAMSGPDAILNA